MYMDDIEVFVKNDKELEFAIETIGIFSKDIGMEFVIGKCANSYDDKQRKTALEEIELFNKKSDRTLRDKENYKYLKILETDTRKETEINENV